MRRRRRRCTPRRRYAAATQQTAFTCDPGASDQFAAHSSVTSLPTGAPVRPSDATHAAGCGRGRHARGPYHQRRTCSWASAERSCSGCTWPPGLPIAADAQPRPRRSRRPLADCLSLFLLVHVSMLMGALLNQPRAAAVQLDAARQSDDDTNSEQTHDLLRLVDMSSHSTCARPVNPLVRYSVCGEQRLNGSARVRRSNAAGDDHPCNKDKCLILNEPNIIDLCRLNPKERLRELHSYSFWLRARHANNGHDGSPRPDHLLDYTRFTLWDLFMIRELGIDSRGIDIDQALYDVSATRWLSIDAKQCLAAPASNRDGTGAAGDLCEQCFRRVLNLELEVSLFFEAFNATVMKKHDCNVTEETDVERQFSPNTTCDHCEAWYWQWLLVTSEQPIRIWSKQPCAEWCHYAELACPFLTIVRKRDYAGLSSFRCSDPHIQWQPAVGGAAGTFSGAATRLGTGDCECVHPCDLEPDKYGGQDNHSATAYIRRRLRCDEREALRKQCDDSVAGVTPTPVYANTGVAGAKPGVAPPPQQQTHSSTPEAANTAPSVNSAAARRGDGGFRRRGYLPRPRDTPPLIILAALLLSNSLNYNS